MSGRVRRRLTARPTTTVEVDREDTPPVIVVDGPAAEPTLAGALADLGDEANLATLEAAIDDASTTARLGTAAARVDLALGHGVRLSVPLDRDALVMALALARARHERFDDAIALARRLPTDAPAVLVLASILADAGDRDAVVALGEFDIDGPIPALVAVLGAASLRAAHRSPEGLALIGEVLGAVDPGSGVGRRALDERARLRATVGNRAGSVDASEAHGSGWVTPEHAELSAREAELRSLDAEVVEAEVILAGLRADLDEFDAAHAAAVGDRYVRLDRLAAALAAASSAGQDGAGAFALLATDAAARAAATESAVAAVRGSRHDRAPTADLKQLYRELARRLHPDVAREGLPLKERSALLAEATTAYRAGDLRALQRLAARLAARPDGLTGDDAGTRLVLAIRGIATLRARLADVAEEIARLRATPLNRLREQAEAARRAGHDLLAELAGQLDAEIAALEAALAEVDAR